MRLQQRLTWEADGDKGSKFTAPLRISGILVKKELVNKDWRTGEKSVLVAKLPSWSWKASQSLSGFPIVNSGLSQRSHDPCETSWRAFPYDFGWFQRPPWTPKDLRSGDLWSVLQMVRMLHLSFNQLQRCKEVLSNVFRIPWRLPGMQNRWRTSF